MANPWFRMYGEFATDPKVQMLTEVEQRRYLMLLCLRCSNGDVTLQDEQVAFQLRISNEEWLNTKGSLLSKKLISKDSKPTSWDKRQYLSDTSAPRVAKHRAKVKQACNVTVTAPDTDTDTETTLAAKTKAERGEAFGIFWNFYPKKKSKGAAEKAWNKINPDEALLQVIMAALQHAKTQDGWAKDAGQFIPHPATWLNARGWEDDFGGPPDNSAGSFAAKMMGVPA